HPIAGPQTLHSFANRIDPAPPLVTRCAGLERVPEPGPALPDGQVGAADAAALQLDAHLAGARGRGLDALDRQRTRLAEADRTAAPRLRAHDSAARDVSPEAATSTGCDETSQSCRRATPSAAQMVGDHPVAAENLPLLVT